MKKFAILLALPLVLAACGTKPADTPTTTEPTPPAAETTKTEPTTAATFPAPVVTSVADGATVTTPLMTIAGTVDAATTSISINGFTLTKFKAGDTKFSYVAKPAFKNLTIGENTYTIVAKNAAGETSQTVVKVTYAPAK